MNYIEFLTEKKKSLIKQGNTLKYHFIDLPSSEQIEFENTGFDFYMGGIVNPDPMGITYVTHYAGLVFFIRFY